MMSVAIPSSVTNIGVGAFADCRKLTGVTVPLHIDTMEHLFPAAYDKITAVQVAERRDDASDQMAAGMFYRCGALERIDLPDWVVNIPDRAFVGCTNLSSIVMSDAVTNIGASAFSGLSQLDSFTFPTGLVSIGRCAFSSCSGIAMLRLPEGLCSIGPSAFSGLELLSRVDIPSTVATIGWGAFYGCEQVRSISMPGYMISDDSALSTEMGDVATVEAIFPDAYDKITSAAVVGGNVAASLFEGCAALAKVEMPSSQTAIGSRAFAGCAALTEVGIPSGVTSLGAEVFSGCSLLSAVALPSGLSVVPAGAFEDCVSLVEVVVPEGVESVGDGAFSGCTLLRAVRFVGDAPACNEAAYADTSALLVTYVVNGSRGWDGIPTSKALPEFWPAGTTHDITFWVPNRFMVTFDSNDGATAATEVEQVTGTTYALPSDPTRRGAVFAGWWTATDGGARVTAVTQVTQTRPHTFYAHWTFNCYTVHFDANGGEGEMEGQQMTVATGANLSECTFTRPGYVFIGWAPEPDGEVVYANAAEVVDLAYAQNAAVTLYAVWEEHAWTLGDALCEGSAICAGIRAVDSADWSIDLVTSHDGAASVRNGAIGAAADEGGRTNSTIEVTVKGAGSGSFWWKVSCEEMDEEFGEWYDYAVFTIDGAEIAKIAGDSGWQHVEYTVAGDGMHTLAWTFTRDDYDEPGAMWENAAWVDDLGWTPEPKGLTLADAIFDDESDIEPTTGGYSVWTLDTTAGSNVVAACAKSGAVASGEESWIEVSLSGVGTLAFKWKVMGGSYRGTPFAYAKVEVDGVQQIQEYETEGWKGESLTIDGAGAHTVRWTYLRTSSRTAEGDCACLDGLAWVPSEVADPIPEVAVDADAATVNATVDDVGFADASAVKAAIGGSAEEYNAFKTWADGVKGTTGDALAGEAAVVANEHAASAYLLGAERLFENEPTVEIGEFAIAEGESAGTTAMAVSVTVKDGENAVKCTAEKVKEMFEATGDLGDWTGAAKLTPTVTTSGDDASGKMTFVVTPGDGTASKAFLRIRK